ncbi:hypothetical protein BIT28_15545 [Photobacterium proteolyticum]|uniref:Uncharacterized protein n=1 Tax=Photobacterium proteolyticum TaxID=1903952 RepID=A0A1Q9G917_9GAMM|nr:hypothetical protein [Photobacterium proteolyticum]OLQ70824.1 hypothetical protein BIT28_15545 [Photobacterium proteolyticum]
MFKTPKNDTVVSVYEPVEFPVEDHEDLALNLDVINLAKQQARKELPSSNASLPDANEVNFTNIIKTKLTQAVNSVDQSTSNLKDEINSLSVSKELSHAKEMSKEFERDISSKLMSRVKELEQKKEDLNYAEDDLNQFKKKHGLRRSADYPLSHWLTVGILLMALIFEAFMNGMFFSKGSDEGLVGGIIYATLIAIINIGIGFIFGWWLLRYKNHCSKFISLASILSFTILMIIPFIFNLLIGHYREALVIAPDNAHNIAITSFKQGMLSISDINSWLLFTIGMMFCFLAIYKGYGFDDAYPGYGKISRRKDNLEEELLDDRESMLDELDDIHSDYLESLDQIYDNVVIKEKQLSNLCSAFDHQNRILKGYKSHLNNNIEYVINLYRDTNESERETTSPNYFISREVPHIGDIHLDIKYTDKQESIRQDKEQLAVLLPGIRNAMLSSKEEYQTKIDKIYKS